MKILIKENFAFGKYYGCLVNDNLSIVELPSPINMSATRYTGEKENIIKRCKEEALLLFNETNLDILDLSLN